ncbi:MAG: hypothetical protein M1833_004086 [Piccolia ochrophora]|nr:MAG: hypothetical protein M1833_004086 [Piccolia ochrophora]
MSSEDPPSGAPAAAPQSQTPGHPSFRRFVNSASHDPDLTPWRVYQTTRIKGVRGALRCRQSRGTLHQLRGFFHRVQDSDPEEKEANGKNEG